MSEKRFLKFEKIEDDWYEVLNKKGQFLGTIQYAKGWKRKYMWLFYCIPVPAGEEVWFASGCLREIAEFMENLEAVQK